ncbi:hypothetical protein ACHAQH_004223 [Verticillium albo-atrum]
MASSPQCMVSGYDEIPKLLPLETIEPKMYVKPFLVFELQEAYDIDHLTRVLDDAYQATKKRIPVLDCKVVPDHDADQKGIAKLEKLAEEEVPPIVFKDLRSKDAFSFTYDELKANDFPPVAFDSHVLSSLPPAPAPGAAAPVAALQINFIRGGMVLCLALHHVPGDARAFLEWTKVLAVECRPAQGIELPDDDAGFDARMLKDRERLRQRVSSDHSGGTIEDHPEYMILPFVPEANDGSGLFSKTSLSRVFYLSPESLETLKRDAAPSNATQPPDDVPWISTMDALMALIWRTVVRAQTPLDGLEGDAVSRMSFGIDNRKRTALDPPLHPHTLGNFFSVNEAALPAREVLTKASVADLAAPIRRGLQRKDGRHYDSLVTVVRGLDHVERLVLSVITSLACSAMATSWADLEYYDVTWGPLLGDRVEALRTARAGVMNTIMPRLPDGGIEVALTMEPDAHQAVLQDPVWTRYARLRGELDK